jgi:hypothetical protein
MTDLEVGDVVYSVISNHIKARAVLQKKAVLSPNPFTENDMWGREGWMVEVTYDTSITPMHIKEHIEIIRDYLPDKYSPFHKETGRGNQGYLFAISRQLGAYIESVLHDSVVFDPSGIFETYESGANLIHHTMEAAGIEEGLLTLVETERPEGTGRPIHRKQQVYGKKTDFITKSQRDSAVGLRGEELVMLHERAYLSSIGRSDLASKVQWVSRDADGYGYDVLSFDEDGNEKYIEVKTTTLARDKQPFDVSKNEVETSNDKGDQYWIYRIYDLEGDQPKVYKTQGPVEENFDLEPSSFKAYLK